MVARLPRRRIQVGMGVALLVAATMFLMAIFGLFPAGGTALGLTGVKLGVAGAFVLGALMTIGIGCYAPSMIMISLLGMNPTTAFPVMMGSAAFLMPVASLRFLRAGRYSLSAALGLAASPSSGQGASMAIEDAVVLAQCLRDLPEPARAFAAFEELRRPRVERVVAFGARSSSGKAVGPIGRVVRDLMLPVVLKVVAKQSQDWLFDDHIDWDARVTLRARAA